MAGDRTLDAVVVNVARQYGYEDRPLAYQQMVQLVPGTPGAVADAQRRKLSNETMNRILHELDLEESRPEISGTPLPPAQHEPCASPVIPAPRRGRRR